MKLFLYCSKLHLASCLGLIIKNEYSFHKSCNKYSECFCSAIQCFQKNFLQTMSPEQFNNLMLVTVYLEWLNALNLISIASKFSDCKLKENQFF